MNDLLRAALLPVAFVLLVVTVVGGTVALFVGPMFLLAYYHVGGFFLSMMVGAFVGCLLSVAWLGVWNELLEDSDRNA
jgi:uncharacterized membrane protein YraQ (UPF0718 family)